MKKQLGFSLIELLLAGALATGILLTFASLLITNINSRSASQTLAQLQKTGDFITSDISNNVRWAQAVTLDTSNSELIITEPDNTELRYNYNAGLQTLDVTDVDSGVTNALHSDNYIITNYQVDPVPRNNPTSIQINFTVQEIREPNRETEYTTTVTTRKAKIECTPTACN